LADLQKPATKEFYDEFARFDPKPAYTGEGGLPTRSSLSQPDSLVEPEPAPVTSLKDSPFGSSRDNQGPKDAKATEPPTPAPAPTPAAPPSPPEKKK
jgi:hypothetical protein